MQSSSSEPALHGGSAFGGSFLDYMAACREWVIDEIRAIVPHDTLASGGLYELMLDYPLRPSKGLRPALCIATCRLFGGQLSAVLRSAAVLELYHNAFLIHDDIEDGSEKRRDEDTLQRTHGVPIAVNVGDGMLALAMQPLLDNTRLIGLGRALRVIQAVARMARISAEGQMLELNWIRGGRWRRRDYMRMVYKKTAHYSFIAPVEIGGIAAGAAARALAPLFKFAGLIGVAFQIQDDVLNLAGDEAEYGKETAGDLWEGKQTLILTHALGAASESERAEAERILAKPRPALALGQPGGWHQDTEQLEALLHGLVQSRDLTPAGQALVATRLDLLRNRWKTPDDVAYLRRLIERAGSIDYAWTVASRYAHRAAANLAPALAGLPASGHRDFLEHLADFVVNRCK